MNKSIIILISFLIVLSLNIRGNENNGNEICFIKQTKVNEPDTVLINSINKIDYSPNQKLYLASSFMDEDIYLFDAKTDTMLTIFIPSEDLSDTIADFMNKQGYNFQCVSTKKLFSLNPKMNVGMIHPRFTSAEFISDSLIIILGSIQVVKFPLNVDIATYYRHLLRSYDIFVTFNIVSGKIVNLKPIKDKTDSQGQWESFFQNHLICTDRKDNTYLLICRASDYYTDTLKSGNYYTVSRFDMNGNFIGYTNKLPQEILATGLNYSLHYTPSIMNNIYGKNYYLYYYLPVVFDEGGKEVVRISNIPENNDKLFDTLIQLKNIEKKSYKNLSDIYSKFLTTSYRNIYPGKKGEFYVWISCKDRTDSLNRFHFINHYRNNKFANQYKLTYKNNNGKIQFVSINSFENKIRIFRKNEENWIVELYRFCD